MEDTIAAVATTIGESSINVIRISGKDSISVANKIFSKDISNVPSHTVHYGFIMEDKEKIEIEPHQSIKINTGLALEIPDGYFGGIFARSGLATKENLRPSNCVGVIDSDYRGEILVSIFNDSTEKRIISNNQRVAQLVIMPYLEVSFNEVDNLSDTIRSTKGFGSTGK